MNADDLDAVLRWLNGRIAESVGDTQLIYIADREGVKAQLLALEVEVAEYEAQALLELDFETLPESHKLIVWYLAVTEHHCPTATYIPGKKVDIDRLVRKGWVEVQFPEHFSRDGYGEWHDTTYELTLGGLLAFERHDALMQAQDSGEQGKEAAWG